MAERVRAKVLDILERHEPLPIPAKVEARLKDIVAQADARHKKQGAR
jgi:trimethylamine:corrinoid methyltransferase-like protein